MSDNTGISKELFYIRKRANTIQTETLMKIRITYNIPIESLLGWEKIESCHELILSESEIERELKRRSKIFKDKIQNFMFKKDLTFKTLSKYFDLHSKVFQGIFHNGVRFMKIRNLYKIANKWNCSIDNLFEE